MTDRDRPVEDVEDRALGRVDLLPDPPTVTRIGPELIDLAVTVTFPPPAVLAEMRGRAPQRTTSVGGQQLPTKLAAEMLRSLADQLDPYAPPDDPGVG